MLQTRCKVRQHCMCRITNWSSVANPAPSMRQVGAASPNITLKCSQSTAKVPKAPVIISYSRACRVASRRSARKPLVLGRGYAGGLGSICERVQVHACAAGRLVGCCGCGNSRSYRQCRLGRVILGKLCILDWRSTSGIDLQQAGRNARAGTCN